MDKAARQDLDQTLEERYRRLQEILRSYKKVMVAYSGGVDSTFLLKAALDGLGRERVLACIGSSESLAQSEQQQAVDTAQQLGAETKFVYPREMDNPKYKSNPPQRCYYCKTELYKLLRELAQQQDYDAILCGSNADDLSDFRPGLKAAKEWEVRSPLEEARLSKNDIRTLSKQLGLATWDKPAQPCLASRLTYGLEITPERLKQIEKGEEFLRGLGLRKLRVRHHDELVRIEVPAEKIAELAHDNQREQIVAFFKKLGFTYVSLDLQGFRSGSGNEPLGGD
ncbi:ATP-dependent sacrificial sulfur transferase LarE [Planctomycetota bacterium]